MLPNQINFENVHFDPYYNGSFSDAEDERDPNKTLFNEVITQNCECFYLFPKDI